MNQQKQSLFGAILAALLPAPVPPCPRPFHPAPPAQRPLPAPLPAKVTIPATVLDVRVNGLAGIPPQPETIRPAAIPFQRVPGLAIPGFLSHVVHLLSHEYRYSYYEKVGYMVDPATVWVEDICERVYLTRFYFETPRGRSDPVLPIVFSEMDALYSQYSRHMCQLARLLPGYAAGLVTRYHIVSEVNGLITLLDGGAVSQREAAFVHWHLIGALDAPGDYV